jgi:translation initiation factor 6
MTVIQADVFGSPNIGVYCYCNERIAIVPPGLTNHKIEQFEQTLGVSVCKTTIAGSMLVGALVAGNSNGILVPHTVRDYEYEKLKEFSTVKVVNSRWTALGNIILANDVGAVVHPDTPEEVLNSLDEAMKVRSVQGNIGTLPFVGALGIATNKGAILSPNALKDELSVIQPTLQVDLELSTTNGGVPFVRSGILANSNGAVVGPLTRGAELMQVSKALMV